MKKRLLLCALLLLPVLALAQPVPRIQWEHDGLNVATFKCVVDGSPATTYDLGLLTPTSGTTYSVAITSCGPGGTGLMADGTHTLVIQACNSSNVCTPAASITVVKL